MHDVIIWRGNFFRPWSRDSDLWVYGYVNGAPHWTFLQGGKKRVMLTVHLGIVPLFAFHSTSKHYNTGVDKGLQAIIPSKKETLSILHIQDLSWSFSKTSFYFFLRSRFSFDALTVSLQNKQLIFLEKTHFSYKSFSICLNWNFKYFAFLDC